MDQGWAEARERIQASTSVLGLWLTLGDIWAACASDLRQHAIQGTEDRQSKLGASQLKRVLVDDADLLGHLDAALDTCDQITFTGSPHDTALRIRTLCLAVRAAEGSLFAALASVDGLTLTPSGSMIQVERWTGGEPVEVTGFLLPYPRQDLVKRAFEQRTADAANGLTNEWTALGEKEFKRAVKDSIGSPRSRVESQNAAAVVGAHLITHATIEAGEVKHLGLRFDTYTEVDEVLGYGMPCLATGHPVATFEDHFDVGRDDRGFFPTHPTDHADLIERGQVAVHAANKVGADVVVLPEMTYKAPGDVITPPSAPGMPAPLQRSSMPPLTVPGSAHQVVDGRQVNETSLYLHGRWVLSHRKVRPYSPPVDPEVLGDLDAAEDFHIALGREVKVHLPELIEPGDTWTALCSADWMIGMAICADLHHEPLLALVRALGPNLLLVPALTRRSQDFSTNLSGLSASAQGYAVLANGIAWGLSALPDTDYQPVVSVTADPMHRAAREIAAREETQPYVLRHCPSDRPFTQPELP